MFVHVYRADIFRFCIVFCRMEVPSLAATLLRQAVPAFASATVTVLLQPPELRLTLARMYPVLAVPSFVLHSPFTLTQQSSYPGRLSF